MTLEQRYEERCYSLADQLRTLLGQPRSIFLRMLGTHGAVEATRQLIHARDPSATFTVLWERRRLDLTVEAVIATEPEWDPIFADEDRNAAKGRLKEYGWTPPALGR